MIIARIAALEKNPAMIILTHGHFDHLGAVPALAAAYKGLPVWIHAADAEYLGETGLQRHREDFERVGAGKLMNSFTMSLPEPERLIAEGDTFFAENGSLWQVLHTPGHSPGSVCLYNEAEKVLISGDTLFRNGIGRTDLRGGSSAGLNRSLERLSRLDGAVRVLPGHGGATYIRQELG
jgi:glyoxylase-like metal-dependent hydrolase (beta-lactamase superfamily II)